MGKVDYELDNDSVSLTGYTAVILADIEENLIKDGKNTYTRDEIIDQLEKTGVDVLKVMIQCGYNVDDAIIPNPNELMNIIENTIIPNKN